MDVVIRQTGSGQDHAACGDMNGVQWAVLYDGHGTNRVIDQLRHLNMNLYVNDENPLESIALNGVKGDTYMSGATACMYRRIENEIELFNMGDSGISVFVNGKLAAQTTKHSFLIPDEIERTKLLVRAILPTKGPFPVSDVRVEEQLSPTGLFITGEKLVPSRSIGHNNMTGHVAERIALTVDPTDHVRVVMGSDGLLDMLVPLQKGTALELVDEAERRWRQQWEYTFLHNGKMHDCKTNYGNVIDDISCVVIDDRIKHRPSICIPYSPNVFTTQHVHDVFEQLFGGVRKVEEVVHDLHKVFFIHFNPNDITETKETWKKLLRGENVKAEYNESWWWPLKRMHGSMEMAHVHHEFYPQWDTQCDYYAFESTLISSESVRNMVDFLQAFQ